MTVLPLTDVYNPFYGLVLVLAKLIMLMANLTSLSWDKVEIVNDSDAIDGWM